MDNKDLLMFLLILISSAQLVTGVKRFSEKNWFMGGVWIFGFLWNIYNIIKYILKI